MGRKAGIPLLLLAVAFLAAYAWPVLDSSWEQDLESFLIALSWLVWGACFVDFAVRVVLAEERGRYALTHWYDVALIALPLLRPLRLLRLMALARMLNRTATSSLVGRVTTYAAGTSLMALGLGAIAVLDVEQAAEVRTSPPSGTPCGGRPPRSPRSVTATTSRSQPWAVSSPSGSCWSASPSLA